MRSTAPAEGLPRKVRILVVDDEEVVLGMLRHYFDGRGYEVECTTRGTDAVARVSETRFDVMILDLMLAGEDGLDILRQAREIDADLAVLIMTGYASVSSAVEAIKLGAEDYLLKPLDLDILRFAVARTLKNQRLLVENRILREQQSAGNIEARGLIARSKAMLDILGLVAKVAPLRSTVLIQGESGTGKELLARALHEQSTRAAGRFVAVNCAVIPATLLESELFGHERGSFTGAENRRIGYFEEADGGTIFLDEISETSLDLQVKLLRVLQERTFRRLGGSEEVSTDARVIASTNRRLEDQVREGRFRQDLFYRLNVINVHIPPLRDRPEDIPILAQHFVEKYAKEFAKPVRTVAPGVMEMFLRHAWLGNVRELENMIERAVAVTDGTEIAPEDVAADPQGIAAGSFSDGSPAGQATPYAAARVDFERRYFSAILKAAKGNVAAASNMAGLARQNFYQKLRKLGIERDVGGSSPTS